MAGSQLYPRSTVKRVVKSHSRMNVSKNADVLIFLDYVLFMQELMAQATVNAKKAGATKISARDVRKATDGSLRKFKG